MIIGSVGIFRNLVGVRRSNQDKLHFIKLKFNSKNRLNLFRSKPLVPDFDDSLVPGEENVVHFESIINPGFFIVFFMT